MMRQNNEDSGDGCNNSNSNSGSSISRPSKLKKRRRGQTAGQAVAVNCNNRNLAAVAAAAVSSPVKQHFDTADTSPVATDERSVEKCPRNVKKLASSCPSLKNEVATNTPSSCLAPCEAAGAKTSKRDPPMGSKRQKTAPIRSLLLASNANEMNERRDSLPPTNAADQKAPSTTVSMPESPRVDGSNIQRGTEMDGSYRMARRSPLSCRRDKVRRLSMASKLLSRESGCSNDGQSEHDGKIDAAVSTTLSIANYSSAIQPNKCNVNGIDSSKMEILNEWDRDNRTIKEKAPLTPRNVPANNHPVINEGDGVKSFDSLDSSASQCCSRVARAQTVENTADACTDTAVPGENSVNPRRTENQKSCFDDWNEEMEKLPLPSQILGVENIIRSFTYHYNNKTKVSSRGSSDDMMMLEQQRYDISGDESSTTVSHPILGDVVIPYSNTSDISKATRMEISSQCNSSDFNVPISFPSSEIPASVTKTNLTRENRGANDNFPNVSKQSWKVTKLIRKRRSRHRQADGIRVSLSYPLSFPRLQQWENERDRVRNGKERNTREGKPVVGEIATADSTALFSLNDKEDDKNNILGRIRIVSERGATIRETQDIDKSEMVLGRLRKGDVRDYVEERWLPPPPPDDFQFNNDDEEEEEEEECVGVMRDKIILEMSDLSCKGDDDEGGATRKGKCRNFGWISDRGRFARDVYTIAVVVSKDSIT